jgi:hypothetical protein
LRLQIEFVIYVENGQMTPAAKSRAPGRRVLYAWCMRFSSVLLSGGVLTALCLVSVPRIAAQTAPATSSTAAPQSQTTAPPLQLHDLPPDPHTPTPEEQAEQAAARQRAQIQQLAIAQNNWGPKSSTPGMSLTLKEVSRTQTPNGTQVTYHITGVGFTPDMKLTLLRWPLNAGVTTVMDGIIVDSKGTAVCEGAATGSCSKTMKANDPVEITTTAAKGEAVRVALVAADKKHGAAVSAVPFPVEATDKGCRLDMTLGTKNAEMVLISGEGFKNNDPTFSAGSETFGEKRPLNAGPSAEGRFTVAMTPWVANHDNGDTVVYAQSSTCTTTISFHWGKDTYKVE